VKLKLSFILGLYVVPATSGGKLEVSVSARDDFFKTKDELDRFTKVYMRDALDCLEKACVP
jgi:hypothetical protein